jgi:hypothetical protein
MEALVAENSGMLLWIWLLIAPVVALFLIAPGGTSTVAVRTADSPLTDRRRDRRLTDDSTMVEGIPDSELYSKREIRPS